MKPAILVTAALLLAAAPLGAQHHHDHDHDHDHKHEHSHTDHGHGRHEIGISTGALYGLDHKEWGPGVHLHYFYTLGDHSRWALGAFGEYAWLDGGHYSFGAGIKYEPVERLQLGVFPGAVVAKHEEVHNGHSHGEGWKTKFSAHFEVVYDLFHWDHFHLGPVFDYSWSKDDQHIMLGVHAAFCF